MTLYIQDSICKLSRLCSDDSIELLEPTKESRKMTFKDIEGAPKAARICSKTTVLSFQRFVLLGKVALFEKTKNEQKNIYVGKSALE